MSLPSIVFTISVQFRLIVMSDGKVLVRAACYDPVTLRPFEAIGKDMATALAALSVVVAEAYWVT